MIKIIKFEASWCSPCRAIKPIIEKIQSKFKDLEVEIVDVDEGSDLIREYSVKSIPTLVFLKDGELVEQTLGFKTENELMEIINKHY
jgi:thioredoxin 1